MLRRCANHSTIVSEITTIWIEMHECCLDNIYLSTRHPLCGNLKPRGSDSETGARNVGVCFTELNPLLTKTHQAVLCHHRG